CVGLLMSKSKKARSGLQYIAIEGRCRGRCGWRSEGVLSGLEEHCVAGRDRSRAVADIRERATARSHKNEPRPIRYLTPITYLTLALAAVAAMAEGSAKAITASPDGVYVSAVLV